MEICATVAELRGLARAVLEHRFWGHDLQNYVLGYGASGAAREIIENLLLAEPGLRPEILVVRLKQQAAQLSIDAWRLTADADGFPSTLRYLPRCAG